nr:MAG TPA: hypothetical protein [Caudoviricetes sp.]
MLFLSYVSDKYLEVLPKGLCSESVFCESYRLVDYFGVRNYAICHLFQIES